MSSQGLGRNAVASPFRERKPRIRWLDYARRSWQRLGHLKAVVSLADRSKGTSLEDIAHRFQDTVTRMVEVPTHLSVGLADYTRVHRRFTYDRGSFKSAELQDLYLADSALPSHSGAVTGDSVTAGYRHAVYVEIPSWAVRLSLLRRYNYTVTDRGKALMELRQSTREAFRTFRDVDNPYLLTAGEAYLFLYSLLDTDGDVLQHVLPQLAQANRGLTSRAEVGDRVAGAIEDVSRQRFSRRGIGPDRVEAHRMEAVVAAVRAQKSEGMGPRESVATPRTEPLVDCGVLQRTDPASYSYQLTEGGRLFVLSLAEAASVDQFLEQGLAAAVPMVSSGTQEMPSVCGRQFLARSYCALRSGLGYCSVREVSVLAVALAIDSGRPPFDVLDLELSLLEMSKKYGSELRFTRPRRGEVALVRLGDKVVEELLRA